MTGAEFDEGGGLPAGAFTGEVGGEVDGAGAVHGVFLRVAGLAAAVEDVCVFFAGAGCGWSEDFGEGF